MQASTLFQYQNTLILENAFGEDNGAEIRTSIKALAKYGVCKETSWPYVLENFPVRPPTQAYAEAFKHKISIYARATSQIAIRQALASCLPVVIGILIYESFESDLVAKYGHVPMPDVNNEACLGGHAVCLAGYTKEGWIVRNSWGDDWGLGGYFILPMNYINLKNGLATDAWVINK